MLSVIALAVLALTWGRWVQHWTMSEFTLPWLPVLVTLVVWGVAYLVDAFAEVFSLIGRPVGKSDA